MRNQMQMISEQFQLPGSASPIINNIRELKGEGLTLSQIASRLNSNFETVRKICHEQNIIKPRSIDKRLSSGDMQSFRYKSLSGDCNVYPGHGHWILGEGEGEVIARDIHRWLIQKLGEEILLVEFPEQE